MPDKTLRSFTQAIAESRAYRRDLDKRYREPNLLAATVGAILALLAVVIITRLLL